MTLLPTHQHDVLDFGDDAGEAETHQQGEGGSRDESARSLVEALPLKSGKETSFPFIVKFYSLRFGGFKKNIYFCKD